jgi:hypothetical protein
LNAYLLQTVEVFTPVPGAKRSVVLQMPAAPL